MKIFDFLALSFFEGAQLGREHRTSFDESVERVGLSTVRIWLFHLAVMGCLASVRIRDIHGGFALIFTTSM